MACLSQEFFHPPNLHLKCLATRNLSSFHHTFFMHPRCIQAQRRLGPLTYFRARTVRSIRLAECIAVAEVVAVERSQGDLVFRVGDSKGKSTISSECSSSVTARAESSLWVSIRYTIKPGVSN